MLNSTLRAPIRQLGAVVRATPASTLNASWSRSFASQADARIGGQLWRSLAQDSFQSTLRRSRLGVPQPISGFPRAARRGFRSTAWRRSNAGGGTGHGGEEAQPQTLRGRLRKLMREYGWVAVGVYFGLSFVDLPLSFLIVKIAGADTIGRIEHYIVSAIGSIIPESIRQGSKDLWQKVWQAFKKTEQDELGNDQVSEKVEMVGWGVEEAQERNKEDASLATQLALAYAIHKSFIFIRVPLTAALTPKVVKVLRSWGWNIGKRTRRS